MKRMFPAIAVMVFLALTGPPAHAANISIVNEAEGFMGNTKTEITTTPNGTTLLNYDATGVDKLVVAFGFESGFNNNGATVTGFTFNGVPLVLAVQENTHDGVYDGGTMSLWYLDAPHQGVATFTVSCTTTGGSPNGGHASIIGLAGTAEGIGHTNATWHTQTASGNVDTSLTTTENNSLVVAAVENSGMNNGAGIPTAVSPLTLSNNGGWGRQWGDAASAYQRAPVGGKTLTPTFQTNAGGNIHVVAAEFLMPPPSGSILTVR